MSVLLSNMDLNELCKPYGTGYQYWLENVRKYGAGLSLPTPQQLGQYYHRGKTVAEVIHLAKRR